MAKTVTYELELIRPGETSGPKHHTSSPLGPFVKGQKISIPFGTVQGDFTIKRIETILSEGSSFTQLTRLFLG